MTSCTRSSLMHKSGAALVFLDENYTSITTPKVLHINEEDPIHA